MELQKIGDISAKYNITGRTLRYYEEIGLLSSTRLADSQYRYYDVKAVSRLEQILLLRKLQLSVKDIKQILSSQETEILVRILNNKLNSLKQELYSLRELSKIIEEFLTVIKAKGYTRADGLNLLQEQSEALAAGTERRECKEKIVDMEELKMIDQKVNRLTDVRFIKLRPMRVAYYRAEGASPEADAWEVMLGWAKAQGLDELFETRYFGFNNPSPTPGNPVYGYEVWVTVSDAVKETEDIKIKTFDGGLYAVTNTHGNDIAETWAKLDSWIKEGEYKLADYQWLEETIIAGNDSWGSQMQLDLYYPIR